MDDAAGVPLFRRTPGPYRAGMSRRLSCVALGLVVGLGVLAMPAPAQETRIRPPVPSQTEKPPILRTYLVMVLLGAAVIGANAIPPRRGHQD